MGMIYVDDETENKLKSMGKPSQVVKELLDSGGSGNSGGGDFGNGVGGDFSHLDARLDKLGLYLRQEFSALKELLAATAVDRLDSHTTYTNNSTPNTKVYQGKFYDWEDVQKYWLNGPDNDPNDPAWANKMAARTMSESNDVPEVWEEVGEYIGYRNLEGQFFPIFKAALAHIPTSTFDTPIV